MPSLSNHTTGPSEGSTANRPPGRRLLQLLQGIYLTIRVSTLGFTLLLPLLGAASASSGLTWEAIPSLLAIALAFHVFAYVLNDVADLWVDRSEPLRADSLLVQGRITPKQSLWLAWTQIPIAFLVALQAEVSETGVVMLVLAFGCMTIYDLYGKRCRYPPLTDAIQAVGWCALALFGALAHPAATLSPDTGWLAVYVFVYVLMVNGVHGGLRDIHNDYRQGARTTAIWLGARPSGSSAVTMSRTLSHYALLLQGILILSALTVFVTEDYTPGERLVGGALLGVLLLISAVSAYSAFARTGERRDLVAAGAWHIVVTLAVLPALYLPTLSVGHAIVVIGIFTLPVVAMYLYNGPNWCL